MSTARDPASASLPPHIAHRPDFFGALVWIVMGTGMLYGGWSMERLEKLNINPYTAPGLVPALLGAGLIVLGLLLLARSMRNARPFDPRPADDEMSIAAGASGRRRFFIALVLCLVYGAGLVGRGLPFWLATFLFVFSAVAILQWRERRSSGQTARGLVVAALLGAGTAFAVTLVFQELFLVRLP